MTRWSKVRSVAVFELLCTLRSKGWLITTFGMPVFAMLYAGLVAIPIYLETRKQQEVGIYGVVDEAGALGLEGDVALSPVEMPGEIRAALEATGQREVLGRQVAWFRNFVFRPFASEEQARGALAAKVIRGYYRIPGDYLGTGVVESYSRESGGFKARDSRRALTRLLVERLLHGRVPADVAARVREPIADSRDRVVTEAGLVKEREEAARVVRAVIPLAFAVLLILSIFMSAGSLVQATGIEKENKVVEVLLSSANPDEILMGKLLGQGIAGTLQMAVWFGAVALAGLGFTGMMTAIGIEPPWSAMAAAVVYFPLAYLFFGSLMLGTGSLGANQKEATQWGMVWGLLTAIPILLFEVMFDEPNGVVARVLTWLPFSSPTTVVFRLAVDPRGIAWWEVLGSLAVLIASIRFTIRMSARLFRVGIMLTGARPKLREILRQARLEH